jgi:outer membrane autotransporter protein
MFVTASAWKLAGPTLLVLLIWPQANSVHAQQVLADGTTVTASGVIDMGTTNGDAGIALRARNGGVIQSFSPLTIMTAGSSAIGAQAQSGARINLFSGTTIHTTGSQADGIVASGADSLVTADRTTVLTENVGYGLIAGTGGQITMFNSTIRALVGTGVATFTGGRVTLTNSTLETGTRLALWINPGSSIVGDGLVVTSAAQGAFVDNGTLSLTGSSINSSSIGIQTASGANVELKDTSVSTSGASAYGVYLSGGSTLTMDGGSISTTGASARGIWGATGVNKATLTNADITAGNSSAILAFGAGGILDANLIASSITGNPMALEVGGGATINLNASSSNITGSATTATGSTSNVTLLDGTNWNLTGTSNITALTNDDSLIRFSAPSSDPTVLSSYRSLSLGSYTGVGGNVMLNTYLDIDGSSSDLLVINGGLATGTSGLIIANATGAGALTSGDGILVVDTINGGGTDVGAFHLAAPAVAGPYEYSLFRSSLDGGSSQNWYLRSELIPSPPGPDPTPDYRPEVSLYAAIPPMAAIYGRHLIDTLHERAGAQEQFTGRMDGEQGGLSKGAWLRGIGHWGHRDGEDHGIYGGAPEFDYRFGALQGGLDLYRNEHRGILDNAGIYIAYGHGVMDVTQDRLIETRKAGKNDFGAFSLGGYWTRFGEDGWYVDSVVQGTWYGVTTKSNRATVLGFPDQNIDGFGFAASIEGGYPIRLGDEWQIEPQAQILWQTVNMSDFNDGAADISYDDLNSLIGRVGLRLARTWEAEQPTSDETAKFATMWGRVSLLHEFTAEAQTEISSAAGFVPFSTDLDETWVEIGVGATRQLTANTYLYGNANFSTTFEGSAYAWNGKVGLKVTW